VSVMLYGGLPVSFGAAATVAFTVRGVGRRDIARVRTGKWFARARGRVMRGPRVVVPSPARESIRPRHVAQRCTQGSFEMPSSSHCPMFVACLICSLERDRWDLFESNSAENYGAK
jgi:hypothetical protein